MVTKLSFSCHRHRLLQKKCLVKVTGDYNNNNNNKFNNNIHLTIFIASKRRQLAERALGARRPLTTLESSTERWTSSFEHIIVQISVISVSDRVASVHSYARVTIFVMSWSGDEVVHNSVGRLISYFCSAIHVGVHHFHGKKNRDKLDYYGSTRDAQKK